MGRINRRVELLLNAPAVGLARAQVDVLVVGRAVDEGLESSAERSDGIAVALVLDLEVGERRDDVLGRGVADPEFGGEARGGEVELEVLDVNLAIVGSLAGQRGEASEPLGQAGDGLESVAFVLLSLTPLLLGRGELLASTSHDLAPPRGGV